MSIVVVPTAPGGSKWERNIPPPEEVRHDIMMQSCVTITLHVQALEMTPEEEEWEQEWMQWNNTKQ